MYKFILLLGICSAFASDSKPPGKHRARLPITDNNCQKILGCAYTNYENMQMGSTLNIDMIDVSLCTHLFYSMVELGQDASVQVTDESPDIEGNGFQRFNDLRKKNKRLKTLINMQESIREANSYDNNTILVDPNLREKLVNNVVNFVQKYKFNGIELQSQYLAQENTVASDKQNFVLLLKAFKEKFDKNGLILSLAVDFRESTAKKHDIKEISKYVSFINLAAYNFHVDTYDRKEIVTASHVAPLYHSSKENTEDRKLNVDYIVKYWLSQGAPPRKLILGISFSGPSYTLSNPKKVGRDAPVVKKVEYVGLLTSYCDFCPWENNRAWNTFWDKEQQVPYIYKGKEMIAYDNVGSIKMKAEYAESMKLGGVFVDSLVDDDYSGHCGGEKFPLLRAVNRVLRDKC